MLEGLVRVNWFCFVRPNMIEAGKFGNCGCAGEFDGLIIWTIFCPLLNQTSPWQPQNLSIEQFQQQQKKTSCSFVHPRRCADGCQEADTAARLTASKCLSLLILFLLLILLTAWVLGLSIDLLLRWA